MPFVEYLDDRGIAQWEDRPELDYTGGPSMIWLSGRRSWLDNCLHHREDGPAVIWSNGDKEWWLNGKQYEATEWLLKVHELKYKTAA